MNPFVFNGLINYLLKKAWEEEERKEKKCPVCNIEEGEKIKKINLKDDLLKKIPSICFEWECDETLSFYEYIKENSNDLLRIFIDKKINRGFIKYESDLSLKAEHLLLSYINDELIKEFEGERWNSCFCGITDTYSFSIHYDVCDYDELFLEKMAKMYSKFKKNILNIVNVIE